MAHKNQKITQLNYSSIHQGIHSISTNMKAGQSKQLQIFLSRIFGGSRTPKIVKGFLAMVLVQKLHSLLKKLHSVFWFDEETVAMATPIVPPKPLIPIRRYPGLLLKIGGATNMQMVLANISYIKYRHNIIESYHIISSYEYLLGQLFRY